jgi:hypothetical protein
MTYMNGQQFSGLDCGCGGKCGSGRTQMHGQARGMGVAEFYVEDEPQPPRETFAPLSSYGEMPMVGSFTKTVKVTGKSYIGVVGSASGAPYCATFDPIARGKMYLLAKATDAAYSENPLSDIKDKHYRLYSSRNFNVTCENGRITNVTAGPLDTDAGIECIPKTTQCLQPPPLISSDIHASPSGPNSFNFSWTVKGRPHLAAEPAFQMICPRTSVYIWHKVQGQISCAPNDVNTSVQITGSAFPSHRVYVGGSIAAPTIPQGNMSNLWVMRSMSEPLMVR